MQVHPEVSKLIKGIVICKETGIYLLDFILDTEINPILLSSFVGALSLFGEENMGRIEEITIKGLDIQMIIVNKYNLTLIAILDKDFARHNIRKEAEKSLDMFYNLYCDEIGDDVDTNAFDPFKEVLIHQINKYFENLVGSNSKSEIRDFGFFTDAITKLRNHS